MQAPVLAVCLAGPTGTGKTALALALAERHAVEIVSVDSGLVYRGMDIGTAKPSAAERARTPHHLIDILDPTQRYSAAAFVADATRLIAEIRSRGRLPLLVGGTMLYFKALREGLDAMPPADAALRAAIEAQAAERGWPALHAELAVVDPATAARLARGDSQRIQRALEVYRSSGRALSSWQTGSASTPHRARQQASLPLVALEPASRAWLHQRLAERFRNMLAAGLLDEVRALRARGDLHPALPSMRCVGYRQAWQALDAGAPGGQGGAGDGVNLADLTERGIAATRQLAKRQGTWLRSIPDRHSVPCDATDALERGLRALQQAGGHCGGA